jgi:hypothetical protein
MRRSVVRVAVLVTLVVGTAVDCGAQTSSELNTYFQQNVGLSQDQIAAIQGGQAVAKVAKSRIPDEVFIFGAVYLKAPASGLRYSMWGALLAEGAYVLY